MYTQYRVPGAATAL